jgi:hypothetical protein
VEVNRLALPLEKCNQATLIGVKKTGNRGRFEFSEPQVPGRVGKCFQERKIMAKLTKPTRDRISTSKFAFPKQRKEPLENASHVRNAAARFNQVEGVTEADRRAAWKRIEAAAKRYGVDLKKSA